MNSEIKVDRITASPFYKVCGLESKVTKNIESFFTLSLARGFSKRTVRAYAFDLIVFLRFYQARRKRLPNFQSITIKTLVDFIHLEKSRCAAPASINRRLNTVDLFYRHCFNKLIPGTSAPEGPTHHMRTRRYLTADSKLGIFSIYAKKGRTFRVRVPQKLIQALEPNEVDLFFKTLHTHRDRAIVTLMLVCGLRSAEVIGLKISDLNTLSRTLRVLGKGSKERVVPLPESPIELIERYLECERPVRPKNPHQGALFLSHKGPSRGGPMTLEGLRSLFRYKRAASSVTHANPHRFRHTFGRNMAAAGVSLPVLQKILGHNDHRTTLKYINLTLNDVHADFEKAQKYLSSQNDQ